MSLRRRNRLLAMRTVQEHALNLFEKNGYETTSMEQIADGSQVSLSTIYRHFGNKEGIVIWEEMDSQIDLSLAKRLAKQEPAQAFRDCMVECLAEHPRVDFFLRRVQFIYRTPEVQAAAIAQDLSDRDALALAFTRSRGKRKVQLQDRVLAAICMAALDAAIQTWQAAPEAAHLRTVLGSAFESASEFEIGE